MSTIAFDDLLEVESSTLQPFDYFQRRLNDIDNRISKIAERIFAAKESQLPFFISQLATCLKEFNSLQIEIHQSKFAVELQPRLQVLQLQINQLKQGLSSRVCFHVDNSDQRILEIVSKQLAARGLNDQNFQRVNPHVKPPVVTTDAQTTNVTLTDSLGNPIYYSYKSSELSESSSLEDRFKSLQVKIGSSHLTQELAKFQFCSDNMIELDVIAMMGGPAAAMAASTSETYDVDKYIADWSGPETRDGTERDYANLPPYIERVIKAKEHIQVCVQNRNDFCEKYIQKLGIEAPGAARNFINTYLEVDGAAGELVAQGVSILQMKLELDALDSAVNYAEWHYLLAKIEADEIERELRNKAFESKCNNEHEPF